MMSDQLRDKPHCSILSLPSSARFSTRSQSMFFELASISLSCMLIKRHRSFILPEAACGYPAVLGDAPHWSWDMTFSAHPAHLKISEIRSVGHFSCHRQAQTTKASQSCSLHSGIFRRPAYSLSNTCVPRY